MGGTCHLKAKQMREGYPYPVATTNLVCRLVWASKHQAMYNIVLVVTYTRPYIRVSLSLSLSLYIYIYTYTLLKATNP